MHNSNVKSDKNLVVGIEISRSCVRVVVLDQQKKSIVDYSQIPLESKKESSNSSFLYMASSLEEAWKELNLAKGVRVAIAVGTRHSGIGSGPQIEDWITSLESQVGKRISRAGKAEKGVSYFPLKHVHELKLAFGSLDANLSLVELAPVSVARVLGPNETCSITMDSSIGWRARLHSGYVLEALAYPDSLGLDRIQVQYAGKDPVDITNFSGVSISDVVLTKNSVEFNEIAVALGAALGLDVDINGHNLIEESVGKSEFSKLRNTPLNQIPTPDTQELKAIPSFPSAGFETDKSTAWPISTEVDVVVAESPQALSGSLKLNTKTSNSDVSTNSELSLDEKISLAPPMPEKEALIDLRDEKTIKSQNFDQEIDLSKPSSQKASSVLGMSEAQLIKLLLASIAFVGFIFLVLVIFK